MIQNQNILCIALPTWEGEYTKTIVQIMSLLARNNRVLYVDYPFTVKDMAMTLKGSQKAPWDRMMGLRPRLRPMSTSNRSTVHVLTSPPVLPANWLTSDKSYQRAMALNGRIIRGFIQRALEKLGMDNPIVINAFNPFYGVPLAGAFDESLSIYYCYDNIGAAAWANRHGRNAESALIKNVDAVITTSVGLFEMHSRNHPDCFLVKNGVDFSLFNQAAASPPIRHNPPVIGFIGSLDERMDYDLLSQVIRHNPDKHFRFIGRVVNEQGAELLSAYNHVELTGPKPVHELPDALQHFDIGIIPFIQSEFTRNIYPLKINEYLAAGKPVVMTDFADLKEFSHVTSIAGTAPDFSAALCHELQSDHYDKHQERIRIAQSNSWENRVEQISDIITQLQHKAKAS